MNTQLIGSSRPTKVVNFARVLPLFSSEQGTQQVIPSRSHVGTHLALRSADPAVALVPRRGNRGVATSLAKLPNQTFSIPTVQGTLQPIAGTSDLKSIGVSEMNLAPGLPRFVNAATLKRMLKAKSSELLLKRIDGRWEVMENSGRIDLLDDSVEFRLGAIQIFS